MSAGRRETRPWDERRDKWLRELWVSDMPTTEIARLMQCSAACLNDRAHAIGLPRRNQLRGRHVRTA
jgi:hypothetical protein